MKKLLLNKTLLLAFMLAGMSAVRGQELTYDFTYDITADISLGSTLLVSAQEGAPSGLAFSDDGLKLFVVGSLGQEINQYTLSDPFDISSSSHDGILDISDKETQPQDITFSSDGFKLFIIGDLSDNIHQYTLTSAFDITSGVTFDGSHSVVSQESQPMGMAFSADGLTLLVVGRNGDEVNQYALTNAFDITSGVSVEGSPFSVSSEDTSPSGIAFNADGTKMFITGWSSLAIHHYDLTTPYDITSGASYSSILFNLTNEGSFPNGLEWNSDGSKFYTINFSFDNIRQYDLQVGGFVENAENLGGLEGSMPIRLSGDSFINAAGTLSEGTHFSISNKPTGLSASIAVDANGTDANLSFTGAATNHQLAHSISSLTITLLDAAFQTGPASSITNAVSAGTGVSIDFADNNPELSYSGGFTEAAANIGAVEGSLVIEIVDEKFANVGSTLTYLTDYDLSIPSGLTPTLTVAADGYTATLTLSGSATDHQDVNDVSSIGIDFFNSAFQNFAASSVANASKAETGIGIDFDDNNATVSYGYTYTLEGGLSFSSFVDLSADDTNVQDVYFNNDGSKMYVVGNTSDAILQYSLAIPYEIGGSISLDGSFDFSSYDVTPTAVIFNPSGDKMYVVGLSSSKLYQFSLSAAFDITTGVTSDGSQSIYANPQAVAFNSDGTRLFVYGGVSSSSGARQYALNSAYDITTGISLVTSFATNSIDPNPRGIVFSDNGFLMFVVGLNDIIYSYQLDKAFDLQSGVTQVGSFNMSANVDYTSGITFDASGSRLFLASTRLNVSKISEYKLGVGGFTEGVSNDGSVDGSIVVRAFEAQFANGGSTLSTPTDFTITGIPTGLSPVINVAADGLSATLTLSGSAVDHQNADDVDNLIFDFSSSAFVGDDFDLMDNVSGVNSKIGVDFNNNNPIITYGLAYDVSNGATLSAGPVSISAEETGASGVAFSANGSKMFVVGSVGDEINQYSLTTAFDLSDGITPDGTYDISGQEELATGITFSSDGLKVFICGDERSDVNQYSLTSAFDITSGVTFDGSFYSPHDNSPQGIAMSKDGSKMFILGSSDNEVNQYSLSTPFDITSGVSFDGVTYDISGQETSPRDLTFSLDGTIMHIIGSSGRDITQYNLTVPFNLSTGVSVGSTFSIVSATTNPSGLSFDSNGDRFYVLNAGEVDQFDIEVGGFTETALNDGEVEGSVTVRVTDDQFSNAGSTLAHSTDYTITNLPTGLIPNLSVAADGLSASLTLSGQVTDHQLVNSIDGLEFTFTNSAFENYSASEVTNAVATNSNITLSFNDNNPTLTYGYFYDFENVAFDGFFNVATHDDLPSNIAFSEDGLTLFLTGRRNNAIYQYALTSPFDVTSGVSYEGLLDISEGEAIDPMDLLFSPDGMTLLVLNDNISSLFGSAIAQYDLSQAYTITSGVAYSGSTFDLPTTISHPSGFTFNDDGTRLFITNGFHTDERVHYYTLSSPYDISGEMTYDGNLLYEVESESLYDLSFNEDGTSLFVLRGALTDQIDELILEAPYDLTGTITLGQTFSVSSEEDFPQGFIFGPKGNKLYVVGSTGDEVNQYTLTDEGFEENSANDGAVDGSLTIRLVDDFFANAGGSLTTSTHYTISNLPDGLTPSLVVAADGLSADLSFSGNASSHIDADDIAGLILTFENTAFVNSDAASVEGAVNFESLVGIDFISLTWNGTSWLNGTPGAGTDDVVIAGDYSTGTHGIIEVNSITINSGFTFTVDADDRLYVVEDITNNGSLIIESGADLISFETGSFIGNDIIFKRNTRYADGKYSFVGTPIQQNAGMTVTDLGTYVYTYDETQAYGSNDGLNRWIVGSGELIPGVGYTQAFQQEIIFEGVPNVSAINVAGTYTGTYNDGINEETEGWVLVANPYTTAIDVADFLSPNTNIEGAVYIWDDNGSDTQRGTNDDYIVANGTVATNTTSANGQTRYNQALGSAQGFFVKLSDNTDTEVSFTPGMRITGSNSDGNFFRKTTPAYVRINLTSEDGLFRQAIVGWVPEIDLSQIDRQFDARVFNSNAADIIYTEKAGQALAIQGIDGDQHVIPVGINVSVDGMYTIYMDITSANGNFLYLRDKVTDEVVDLSNSSYSFTATAGPLTDRFELLTSYGILGTQEHKPLIFVYDRVLTIRLNDQQSSREFQLISLNGQTLRQIKADRESTFDLSDLSVGVYLVTDGETTTRIILK